MIILWKKILTKASGSRAAVYVRYIKKVTRSTGVYASHRIRLFQNSGFLAVSKNGARIIKNTFKGAGSEIKELYRLSG